MAFFLIAAGMIPLSLALWVYRKGRVRERRPWAHWGATQEEEPGLSWMQVGTSLLMAAMAFGAALNPL